MRQFGKGFFNKISTLNFYFASERRCEEFTPQIHFLLFTLLFFITIFFILALFNHPSADDFCYCARVKELGFWLSQKWWYLNWNGRFFNTALLTLIPLVFYSLWSYKLIPVILIVFFILAVFLFIRSLFKTILSSKQQLVLSTIIIFLYLYKLPSVVEGIYWLASSSLYLLPIILTLFFFAILFDKKIQRHKLVKILLCLFSLAIVGSNEISMVMLDFFLFSLFCQALLKEKKIPKLLGVLVLIALISSVVVYFAPGNTIRSSVSLDPHNLLLSMVSTVFFIQKMSWEWIQTTPLWLLVAFFFSLLSVQRFGNFPKIHPILAVFSSFFLLFLEFFVYFWSTGALPTGRILNFIYLSFLFGFFLSCFAFFQYFYLHWEKGSVTETTKQFFGFLKHFLNLIFLPLLLFYLVLGNNLKDAFLDLSQGTAARYNQEMKERYVKLASCNDDICVLEEVKNRPKTLFLPFSNLSSDPKFWTNICFASCFGKKAVKID